MTMKTDERGVMVRCAVCESMNRVPFEKLESRGKCARCQAGLPHPSGALELSSAQSFEKLIGGVSVPVLVDFWASWCGPCHALAPELEVVAARAKGEYLIAKVSTEELAELAQRFQVRAIPSMILFYKGGEMGRLQGVRPAAEIERYVRSVMR